MPRVVRIFWLSATLLSSLVCILEIGWTLAPHTLGRRSSVVATHRTLKTNGGMALQILLKDSCVRVSASLSKSEQTSTTVLIGQKNRSHYIFFVESRSCLSDPLITPARRPATATPDISSRPRLPNPHQLLQMLRQNVHFHIHSRPTLERRQPGMPVSIWNHRKAHQIPVNPPPRSN